MNTAESNRALLRKLVLVAVGMFGFGFALVPFYDKICEVTGLNRIQKPDQVANTQVDASRTLIVEFDSNVHGNLPWKFAAQERRMSVHPGQLVQVVYEVRNDSDTTMAGQAIPSYGPKVAAQYFRKLDCFCFAKQELKPGELKRMPVVFVIDPGLPQEVHTVTLSYTFFEVNGTRRAKTAAAPNEG